MTAVPGLFLNVYGITVRLHSADPAPLADLAEDFASFRVADLPAPAHLLVELRAAPPPYDTVPPRDATVYTPRNVSFHHQGRTFIDYSGRALAIFHAASRQIEVYSEDRALLYEVAFLFLLSQLGEELDRRGLHRVHALGIALEGRAALVLLPMGGGKSTLVSRLLPAGGAASGVGLLSDDSPLLDPSGELLAFPLRIGLLPGSEADIPPADLRTIQRMEFGPKLLLRHATFADRIVPRAAPGHLFLGRRSLAAGCSITPASRLAALRALLPNCVIGLGLFQGMEFVFHRDPSELGRKLLIALSRLRNCIALVRRSSIYTLSLGRDLEANAATLLAFLRETSPTKP